VSTVRGELHHKKKESKPGPAGRKKKMRRVSGSKHRYQKVKGETGSQKRSAERPERLSIPIPWKRQSEGAASAIAKGKNSDSSEEVIRGSPIKKVGERIVD